MCVHVAAFPNQQRVHNFLLATSRHEIIRHTITIRLHNINNVAAALFHICSTYIEDVFLLRVDATGADAAALMWSAVPVGSETAKYIEHTHAKVTRSSPTSSRAHQTGVLYIILYTIYAMGFLSLTAQTRSWRRWRRFSCVVSLYRYFCVRVLTPLCATVDDELPDE